MIQEIAISIFYGSALAMANRKKNEPMLFLSGEGRARIEYVIVNSYTEPHVVDKKISSKQCFIFSLPSCFPIPFPFLSILLLLLLLLTKVQVLLWIIYIY